MAYEVRLVKLINGEMVLGKWDGKEDFIKDPALLQMIPTQQGGMQMMLLPFGYPFDVEISGEIESKHVLYVYKTVPEELKNKYFEASSNLRISSPGDLKNLNNLAGGAPGAGKIADIGSLLKK